MCRTAAQKLKHSVELNRVYKGKKQKMKVLRTANCGVLLELDGTSLLIDGVAKTLGSYMGTPKDLKENLIKNPPDVLLFTHKHEDHYDKDYAEFYKNTLHSPVLMPGSEGEIKKGSILIESIPTRHIGKNDLPHVSYAITGSKSIWFMGDASPAMLKKMSRFSKPDVLFVPFAYATSLSAWQSSINTDAKKIVVLHLPKKEEDIEGLWDKVCKIAGNDEHFIIPGIGEEILIF